MSLPRWVGELAIAVGAAGVFYAALPKIIQSLLWLILWPRYRLELRGREHLPRSGPVILASNHVSWIDGFIVAATCPRHGRALVNAGIINWPILRTLARRAGLIPVPFAGPRALRALIKAAREALDRGEAIALFPEAQLTRNGLFGPFYRGIEAIREGREDVPVIPVYLDNLWGSVFSFSGGRFFRKWPQGWRRRVTVEYGPAVPPPASAFEVRQAVLATGVRAVARRRRPAPPLETIDPTLPHLDHPSLGPLTGSTPDFDRDGIRQSGQKPGTVGHPLPGVALRVVDDQGGTLPPATEGRLQALVAGSEDWAETGLRAQIDREGFVHLGSGG